MEITNTSHTKPRYTTSTKTTAPKNPKPRAVHQLEGCMASLALQVWHLPVDLIGVINLEHLCNTTNTLCTTNLTTIHFNQKQVYLEKGVREEADRSGCLPGARGWTLSSRGRQVDAAGAVPSSMYGIP